MYASAAKRLYVLCNTVLVFRAILLGVTFGAEYFAVFGEEWFVHQRIMTNGTSEALGCPMPGVVTVTETGLV